MTGYVFDQFCFIVVYRSLDRHVVASSRCPSYGYSPVGHFLNRVYELIEIIFFHIDQPPDGFCGIDSAASAQLPLNPSVDFLAVYWKSFWCVDSDLYLSAFNAEHGNGHVVSDSDGLADSASKDGS